MRTDLVGVADIADRCAVKTPAVSNWIARYPSFPKPYAVISRGEVKVWRWVDVDRWISNRKKWSRAGS